MKAQDWLNSLPPELICTECNRKSLAKELHEICDFPQPNGNLFKGIFAYP